jgi:hypothetical protein
MLRNFEAAEICILSVNNGQRTIALKDILHENSYVMSLSSCPEFIEQMALVIGRKDKIALYERRGGKVYGRA